MIGDTVGDYQITGLIGSGGMGDVYRATHVRTGREVALKFLATWSAEDSDERTRFRREIDALAKFDHPGIIKILDYVDDGSMCYYAVEFYPGGTLKDRLVAPDGSRRSLPVREATNIAKELLRGLEVIHAARYLHRDIKPANIFFDVHGKAVLGDFGLVMGSGLARLTLPHQVVGTPQYLPPETTLRQDIDCRADLYQLGLILYEMVGGEPAYKEISIRAGGAFRRELPPLVTLQSHCPIGLSEVVASVTQVDAQKRFESAREMLRALEGAGARSGSRPGKASFSSTGTIETRTTTFSFSLEGGTRRVAGPMAGLLVLGLIVVALISWLAAPVPLHVVLEPGVDSIRIAIAGLDPGPVRILYAPPGEPSRVREVSVDRKDLTVTLTDLEPGRPYEIRITAPGNHRPETRQVQTRPETEQIDSLALLQEADRLVLDAGFAQEMTVEVSARGEGGTFTGQSPAGRQHRVELPAWAGRGAIEVGLTTRNLLGQTAQDLRFSLSHPPDGPRWNDRIIPLLNALFSHVNEQNDFAAFPDEQIEALARTGVTEVHFYCDPSRDDPRLEDYIRKLRERRIDVGLVTVLRKLPENLDEVTGRVARWLRLTGVEQPFVVAGMQLDTIGWLEDEVRFTSWLAALDSTCRQRGIVPRLYLGAIFSGDPESILRFLKVGGSRHLDGVIVTMSTVLGGEAAMAPGEVLAQFREMGRTWGKSGFTVLGEARVAEKVYNVGTDRYVGLLSGFIPDDPVGRATLQTWQSPFSYNDPSRPDYLPEEDRVGPQMSMTLRLLAEGVSRVVWANPQLILTRYGEARVAQRAAPYSYRLIGQSMDPKVTVSPLDRAAAGFRPEHAGSGVEGLALEGPFGRRLILWTLKEPRLIALGVEAPVTTRALYQPAHAPFQIRVHFPRRSRVRIRVSPNPVVVELASERAPAP